MVLWHTHARTWHTQTDSSERKVQGVVSLALCQSPACNRGRCGATHTHIPKHTHPVDRDAWWKTERVTGCTRDMLRKLVCKKFCARKIDAFYVSYFSSPFSHSVLLYVFLGILSFSSFSAFASVSFNSPPYSLNLSLFSLSFTFFAFLCLPVSDTVSW